MEVLRFYPHNTRGTLITFCGLDGCGKTTMINRLAKYLISCGKEVLITKQPTDNVRTSDIFRTFMDKEDHSAYSYRALSLSAAADRVQHTEKVVMPALESGKTVISDRYFYSCLANLRARGYLRDRWIYEISEHIPAPDHAFFIDVPAEVAISRVRLRPTERNKYIDEALQYRLREEYIAICEKCLGTLLSGQCGEEETFAEILKNINAEKNVHNSI